ncbi:MAG: transcription termination factor Rho, partial [Opitutales bacterium]|nr:transcription termination factor Rho [Opitutales bacterium]
DIFCPIGKGTRGLVVAPPRTGKTTLLKDIAFGVLENHPECKLIIVLIDERPEEVTDFRMEVPEAEIYASSNDENIATHIRISDLAIERAKHLVETGADVVLLMDSLTRLSRAHNSAKANGGRTMSGGLDIRALERPRQIFSAARNTDEAGSLTIIASALVETGSRMDDLIFQEFKGTGNMEMVLDRKVAELRIWPAINISASGTRREELLLTADELEAASFLRRAMAGSKTEDCAETLINRMKQSKTNKDFISMIL